MPLKDLTPELRTRLSRVERTVGWFVGLATLILVAGFTYYIYNAAKARGWFLTKINYATSLNDGNGLVAGDPVKLMGFPVGEITAVLPNDASAKRGVTIFFSVRDPYYGYIWWDSRVRVTSDFLGHRGLEVLKGESGRPSVYKEPGTGTLLVMNRHLAWMKYQEMLKEAHADPVSTNLANFTLLNSITNQLMEIIKTETNTYYTNAVKAGYTHAGPPPKGEYNYYWITPLDSPALSDRLDALASSVEAALPNFLKLTNQLITILSNADAAVAQLHSTLADTHPIMTNLAEITGNLRNPDGSLGKWVLSSNMLAHLEDTIQSANATLKSAHATLDLADTNVTMLADDLDHTLVHLSDLTSNLSWQVQVNTNIVGEISTTITHADGLIQGLKREWFLRSAFKAKKVKGARATNAPPE